MTEARKLGRSKVVKLKNRINSRDIGNSNAKLLIFNKSFDELEDITCGIEEVDSMDSKDMNDVVLKYIESMDKKYDDYKRDMIESEKRIYRNTKDSEERMEKRQQEFEKRLDSRFERIEKTFDKIDHKFDMISNEVKENNKYLRGLSNTIIGLALTTILSIVGIAVTVYLSLK